jgi:hypothetical protein
MTKGMPLLKRRHSKSQQAAMQITTSYFPVCRVQYWSKSRTVLLCYTTPKRKVRTRNFSTDFTVNTKQHSVLTLLRRSQSAMRARTLWCLHPCPSTTGSVKGIALKSQNESWWEKWQSFDHLSQLQTDLQFPTQPFKWNSGLTRSRFGTF